MLVLAAEDYSGTHPGPVHPGPEYLSAYTDALQSLGVSYDVYDIDARGRTAPDPLGVLSHYDAVVWYTGDDIFVREPGQPASTGTSRVFGETILAARDYLNDGGKLLVSGQQALIGAWAQLDLRPVQAATAACNNLADCPSDGRCVPAADDFMQYWLGAMAQRPRGGRPAAARRRRHVRAREPVRADALPGGAGRDALRRLRPAGRVQAASRGYEVRGRRARDDESDQRLDAQDRPERGDRRQLRFTVSYDIDVNYDYVFVEAREVGQSTGRRCPTSTATPAPTPATRASRTGARPAPAPRALPDDGARARRPARPARGTPADRRLAAATRTGTSTCRHGPASRSTSSIAYAQDLGHGRRRRLRRRRA